MSISADGRYLAFITLLSSNFDLWVLPLSGSQEPIEVAASEFNESAGQFSPDGRWLAYQSDESGRFEIYVVPFPALNRKWRVSLGGGFQPRWRGDGRELFFLTPEAKVLGAEVDGSGGEFAVGEVQELFSAPRLPAGIFDYDVTPDGERFLMNSVSESAFEPITLVVNWTAELESR